MSALNILVGPPETMRCPGCGRSFAARIGAGPPANRAAICPGCETIFVTTSRLLFRLPTAAERARIEASGLAADLREDAARFQVWRHTGTLPPKRCPRPVPEPTFADEGG